MKRDGARRHAHLSVEDLISLAGERDTKALASLYDRHGRAAYSLAYRVMGEKQAAEDLTQEVFLKVWRSAGSYRAGRGSVRTWILSIVRNGGIDQIRAAASCSRTRDEFEVLTVKTQPSEAFAEAWRNSRRDRLREALSTLTPDQREVLKLAYFSEYTHVEISDLLGLPLGTLKGRVRLGLKRLKVHFGSTGPVSLPTEPVAVNRERRTLMPR